MENKYNNGKPIEIPEDAEEKSLAIKAWAENNKHLENAIRSCIDNKIPTYASCRGEHLFDYPYLSMKVNKNNLEKIINIMSSVSEVNNTGIALSYMERQGTILTITTDMLHRNTVFNKIADTAEKEVDSQHINPTMQDLWSMHKELRMHYQEHSLEIKKSRFYKTMTIIPYSETLCIYVLDQLKIKRTKNPYQIVYAKRFSNIDKLKEFFSSMTKMVKDTFQENPGDELVVGKKQPKENNLKQTVKFDIEPVALEKLESAKKNERNELDIGANEQE